MLVHTFKSDSVYVVNIVNIDLNFDIFVYKLKCTLVILVIRVMDSRLAHPFTGIVSGPTGSGKSVFTLELIEHAQEILLAHHPNESYFVTVNITKYLKTIPELNFTMDCRR